MFLPGKAGTHLQKAFRNTTSIIFGSNGYSEPHRQKFSTSYESNTKSYKLYTALVVSTVVSSSGIYAYYKGKRVSVDSERNISNQFPLYTMNDVSKHATKEDRIWVTYKNGVYDITDFVEEHPGGDNVLLAAGSAVDPFWMIYGVHKQNFVLKILEKYQIGILSEEESKEIISDMSDPYVKDPNRNPILQVNAQKPFNAEPPLQLLVRDFITPKDLFYIRNHLPVPEVDIDNYELEISGLGIQETTLTFEDLKNKFQKVTVTASIQCAGNRRSEMSKVKPVKGLNWNAGAIGNATWSGVLLRDILKYCGFSNSECVKHIQFEGLDTDPANAPYGASIPIEKALDPNGDVIVAYEMNGEPLTRDHGFPVRVIVPGVVGARNVKWLGRIIISDGESESFWQQNDYKGFSPSVDWDTVDFKTAPAIQELPIVSAICEPVHGQQVKVNNGKIIVKGYAWSGAGRKIIRIDVTSDKGKSWYPARITSHDEGASLTHCWSWSLWQIEVPVHEETEQVEIWAKAVDSGYNTQPESFSNIWNLRGVLGNAYHRVIVKIASQ